VQVEVVYALAARQYVVAVTVAEGATIADAIAAAGSAPDFPAMEAATAKVGIFGNLATAQTPLHEGDRVEIYRPLQVDPKQARRRRAEKKAGKRGKRQREVVPGR
jgi:uncharacterized protein